MEHSKMRNILIYFALKYNGQFKDVYEAIKTKERVANDVVVEKLNAVKYHAVTIVDENYPFIFKVDEIHNPPFVLFYLGNLSILNDHKTTKELVFEDGTRCFTTIEPDLVDGKVIFDYVICCENQDNIDKVLEHMRSKGLRFKDYQGSECN